MLLVANPGSSSRKYALYDEKFAQRASLHVEYENGEINANLHKNDEIVPISNTFASLNDTTAQVEAIFREGDVLRENDKIAAIGLRIVAPGEFFMHDHLVTDEVIAKVREALPFDPIHISGTLGELEQLQHSYPQTPIALISDSAFHATKPNYAWNYGINLQDADRFEIKRYGYHGLSVSAVVDVLWSRGKLPPRVVVCHLGSGSSVSAVFHGRSIDNTMGYSALEGVIMATRSGSIDYTAAMALKKRLNLSDDEIETYLDERGGLLGLAGSDDIRILLEREAGGDHLAHLALATLVHSIHKAIGAMTVAMNGVDLLVFTGTVGERSAPLRKRIVAHLECLDLIIDGNRNAACLNPTEFTSISQAAVSKPIIVVPTNEGLEIAKHTAKLVEF